MKNKTSKLQRKIARERNRKLSLTSVSEPQVENEDTLCGSLFESRDEGRTAVQIRRYMSDWLPIIEVRSITDDYAVVLRIPADAHAQKEFDALKHRAELAATQKHIANGNTARSLISRLSKIVKPA